MEVTNINMEYLEDNDETMVSFTINNTTENPVEQDRFTAILIDANGQELGQMPATIEQLAPGEQYSVSVILKGDLTATKQIQLQK